MFKALMGNKRRQQTRLLHVTAQHETRNPSQAGIMRQHALGSKHTQTTPFENDQICTGFSRVEI